MGFDDGQIVLNSVNNTYYAGQTVYGKLEFDQDEVKTFRGLYVEMKGYCKVHWTTSHTRRVNGHTRTYHKTHESYEEYFHRKVFLVGSDSGQHHLQPGHHEFPFECHIPANCPSSFDGAHGRVKYTIKAVVDRAFKFDQNKKVEIRVIAPLDLNAEPYCKEPMALELMQSYCSWCMNAGAAELLVKLPVSGYCPGQVMPIEVSCSNNSSVNIKKIKFAIKRDITFHAESEPGTRYEHDTIGELKKGPVPAKTTRNWCVDMDVPVIDVVNLRGCKYIDVDYDFKVSIEVGGCHSGTDDACPIIFGNIPLVGFQDDVENPLKDQMPQQPYQIPKNTPGVNPYPNPPIVNQPIPSPYPGYPTASPNIATHYPNANSPYPSGNLPYPSGNSPYPDSTNTGYPGRAPSPVPPGSQKTKTSGFSGTLGFSVQGNTNEISIPLLPPGAGVPYPSGQTNPYASASAPLPPSPGEEKNLGMDISSSSTPYNPEFTDNKHTKDVDKK